jgi:hypothetical protein
MLRVEVRARCVAHESKRESGRIEWASAAHEALAPRRLRMVFSISWPGVTFAGGSGVFSAQEPTELRAAVYSSFGGQPANSAQRSAAAYTMRGLHVSQRKKAAQAQG